MVAFCTEFEVRDGGGWGEHKAWGTEAQFLTCYRPDCQTLNLVKVIERERWEIKTRKKREKWEWLMEGLEPTTWQMACHALTNWATESLGYSVTEFKYLRLSCQGSSWSRYQGGMFDGEGVVRDRRSVFNVLQTWQPEMVGFVQDLKWGEEVWQAWSMRRRGSVFNMFQTWQSDLKPGQSHWERKVRNKDMKEGEKWQWLREGLKPANVLLWSEGGGRGGTVACKTRLCSLFSKHRLIRCLRPGLPRNILHNTFSLRFVLKSKIYIVAKILI